jgi:hypothetical protein
MNKHALLALFLAFSCSALAFDKPPGATNPAVTQATITDTICLPGWSRIMRPPASYTNKIKRELMANAGIPWKQAHSFELDHLVPIELGGDPRSRQNLWLQPWDGDDGARRKDKLENRLHKLVCSGKVQLVVAQEAIAADWRTATERYLNE